MNINKIKVAIYGTILNKLRKFTGIALLIKPFNNVKFASIVLKKEKKTAAKIILFGFQLPNINQTPLLLLL